MSEEDRGAPAPSPEDLPDTVGMEVAGTATPAAVAAENEMAADGGGDFTQELEHVQAELKHLKEQYLRKHADFENFRKRSEREKNDHFKFALGAVFKDLLPVLDNFDRARAIGNRGAEGSNDEYHKGIELIYRQFEEVLRKNGLTPAGAPGETFNPSLHEAIMNVETDAVPPNTVTEVLQSGYYLSERLLRPALVKVAKAPRATVPAVVAESPDANAVATDGDDAADRQDT